MTYKKHEPNTFQMPNILVDKWMQKLDPLEWFIVCYLVRHQRDGYYVLDDVIQHMCKYLYTPVSSMAVTKALNSLRRKGLIAFAPSGGMYAFWLVEEDEEE